ncbi:hypothetical protein GCM10023224_29100 [Streptomonospora halophila]|uniref:DivIVA domain-containing protein n=1 Tax=Streptomonospora halophila TaxID=427369 RepID=A0ABP9GRF2_9ACTN
MSPIISVLIALAAVAVLAGVAFVVMGKGGELARFEADHPPLDLPADRPLSGSDVSRVLLPLSLWGYHVRAVDDVLRRVVGALSERDARIADLERRLQETGRPAPDTAAPETAPGTGSGTGSGPRSGSVWDAPREPEAPDRTGGAAAVRTGAHARGGASPSGAAGSGDRPGAGGPGESGGAGEDGDDPGPPDDREGSEGGSAAADGSGATASDRGSEATGAQRQSAR